MMSGETDLPAGLLEERGADRLHIGGQIRKPGWQILDAFSGDHVDHVGNLPDLSRFGGESFDMVYASHVFEHLGHRADLPAALGEVCRVLRPAGRFFISVPDLVTLARLFVQPGITTYQRTYLMFMIFGSQNDEHDFHHSGIWDDYLGSLLLNAGFAEAYRVQAFNLFDDTSALRLGGVPISLNMVAVK
jgi:predicted SAM-dependent methyltransferase